jgi:hypothetical protein
MMPAHQLSETALRYAHEMAYASKQEGYSALKATIDRELPKGISKDDEVAMKHIKNYGSSIVNMRATSPRDRYPVAQSPSRYDTSYEIYKACMDEITSARRGDFWDLQESIKGEIDA